MKVTYKQLAQFVNAGSKYREQFKKESKLTIAIAKMIKQCSEAIEEFQEKDLDLRRELASTDNKGNLILDENGSYKYTQEKDKALVSKLRELEKTEIEIEPVIASVVPDDLPLTLKDLLTPFVIAEEKEE